MDLQALQSKKINRLRGIAVALCMLSSFSCKKRHYSDRLASQSDTHSDIEFCKAPADSKALWNEERVQSEIQNLIDTGRYKESGLSAYAETYKAMTAQRDIERCRPTGALAPHTPWAGRVNDALADVMTKGYVMTQRACLGTFEAGKAQVPHIGIHMCEMSHRANKQKWTALELSMASTAVYLTSVMGIAISALPHTDALWKGTPHQSRDDRIAALRVSFKPTFDAFNEFLSNNLHTVAQVLLREKRVDCHIFELAARAVGLTTAPAQIFKDIRDETFRLGLELAKTWPTGLHPMTAGEEFWKPDKIFPPFVETPPALKQLYDHGNKTVELLKNPLLKVFKGQDTTHYLSEQGLVCEIPDALK